MEAWRGDGVRAIFKRLSQEGACLGVETREEMDAAAAGAGGRGTGKERERVQRTQVKSTMGGPHGESAKNSLHDSSAHL